MSDLHFTDDGPRDAPAVLLLGSLGSDLSMWDPQLPDLSARFRVLRADLRGHGRSPVQDGPYTLDDLVDDVLALLDRLSLARVHLVGLSLGGMVAMRLAARHPGRVGRLAVLCASAVYTPASTWVERAATVRAHGTSAVAGTVVGRWFVAPDAERAARFERMVVATPDEGYAACCDAIAGADLTADLPRISAPTLAIAGAEDAAAPPERLKHIADAIAGARLVVVPNAAHLANVDQPAAVTTALLLHLDEPGMAVRRAVLGDEHVDRAIAATTPFTAPFQDFITRTAWGDIWTRPGLGRRERSMITLAALTSLGHDNEIAMHVRAALRNGLTEAEIAEVLLHTGIYAGVPAANRAFAIAAETLAAERNDHSG